MVNGKSIVMAGAAAAVIAALAGCGGQPTATGAAVGTPDSGHVEPILFPCPVLTPQPTSLVVVDTPTEAVTEVPGTYHGDDDFLTLQKGTLELDKTGCSSIVTDVNTAEDWMFQGAANQTILIRITSIGDVDPQLSVIDPTGVVIDAEDDHGSDLNPVLTTTLPVDGVYTLRVAVVQPGSYTINVHSATPPPDDGSQP